MLTKKALRSRPKRENIRTVHTKGELNKIVDSLCHPLSKADPAMLILDGFLHGLIERDPPLSARKFLKHNIPRLIEEIGRTYGKEGYKAAKELGKAVRSSIRQVENLRRRK